MISAGNIKSGGGSVAAASISDSLIIIINESGSKLTKKQALQLEAHYLKRMMQDCAGLEWLRLVRKQDENTVSLGLDANFQFFARDKRTYCINS